MIRPYSPAGDGWGTWERSFRHLDDRRYRVHTQVSVPVVCGLWNPQVILPADATSFVGVCR